MPKSGLEPGISDFDRLGIDHSATEALEVRIIDSNEYDLGTNKHHQIITFYSFLFGIVLSGLPFVFISIPPNLSLMSLLRTGLLGDLHPTSKQVADERGRQPAFFFF